MDRSPATAQSVETAVPSAPSATAVTPLLLASSYRQQRPRSEPEVDAEQAHRRAIVAKSRIAKVLAERRGDGDVLGNLVLECDHRLRRRIRGPDGGEVASADCLEGGGEIPQHSDDADAGIEQMALRGRIF